MVRFTAIAATLTLAVSVLAIPTPQDPAGDKNVGNGQGAQFITGACISDADCASGCCAALNGAGVCSAEAVAFAQGKQGCGFSGAATGTAGTAAAGTAAGSASAASASPASAASAGSASANTAAASAGAGAADAGAAGSQNVGKGDGSQFITGQCLSDADCASACCNINTGTCNAIGAVGAENCGFQG